MLSSFSNSSFGFRYYKVAEAVAEPNPLTENMIIYLKCDDGDIFDSKIKFYASGSGVLEGAVTNATISTSDYKTGDGSLELGGGKSIIFPSHFNFDATKDYMLSYWCKSNNSQNKR